MNKKNKNVLKTVGAVVGAVAIAGLGVAAGFALDNPTPTIKYLPSGVEYVNVTNPVNTDLMAENTALKEEIASYEPIIVNNTVVKVQTEYVDLDNTADILDSMEARGIIADATTIVAEMDAEDAAIVLAVAELKTMNLLDLMENKSLITDDDEAELKTVRSDYEDINVTESDFDNNKYSFEIEVKVYDEVSEDYVEAVATVKVEENVAVIEDVN